VAVPYFAADEAQTLDAIFRDDEGAFEGVSYLHTTGLPFFLAGF
jgi:hypothetical protein